MNIFALLLALAAASATPVADVEIKSARLDYARAANTFGYSAIVVNNGPQAARNVEFLVQLPPGAVARNAEPCTVSGALARCALSTLNPGEERRVFMLVLTGNPNPLVVAFAVSETPDANGSNNMSLATTP